jgi:hypothetical protein
MIDLALIPKWGNFAQNKVLAYLPPGTVAYVGLISSQNGFWVGSTIQIYVPK